MKILLVDTSEDDEILKQAIALCCDRLNQNGIETEIRNVSSVHPCTSCGKCLKRRRCLFDGAINEIHDAADMYDGLIVGSEVMYGELSRQAKNFLDCLFRSGNERYAGKIAGCILCERKRNSQKAYNVMNTYFSYSCMSIVTGRYFNTVCDMGEKDQKEMRALADHISCLLKGEKMKDENVDKLVDFMLGR